MFRPSISEPHKLPSIWRLLEQPLPQGVDLPTVQFAPEAGRKTNTRITEIEIPFTPTPEKSTSARMPTGNSPSKSTSSQQTKNLFKCEICSKAYTRRRDLKKHVLIHTGEEPFKCDICIKRFLRKKLFERHMCTNKGSCPSRGGPPLAL